MKHLLKHCPRTKNDKKCAFCHKKLDDTDLGKVSELVNKRLVKLRQFQEEANNELKILKMQREQ
jgi:hypothetical protein